MRSLVESAFFDCAVNAFFGIEITIVFAFNCIFVCLLTENQKRKTANRVFEIQ